MLSVYIGKGERLRSSLFWHSTTSSVLESNVINALVNNRRPQWKLSHEFIVSSPLIL